MLRKITVCFLLLLAVSQLTTAQVLDLGASNRAQPNPTRPAVSPATGPLKPHPNNPRYFADSSGRAVYLVGSHTWANFQDIGFAGDTPFDYDHYLNFMVANHFNFMRFWTWEHAAWATWTPEKLIFSPSPYRRVGPALALDGQPQFDLNQFDQAYFDRMRARIMKARDNGIYTAVMLFQAFSGKWPWSTDHQNDAFRGHFYNVKNNIQRVNGDKDNNSVLDIDDPAVRAQQAAYLRKLIDTVWDLDNVLYEVINEGGNNDWDAFVVKTVRDYEKTKGRSHPIGITGHGGPKMPDIMKTTVDWISPGPNDGPGYDDIVENPPLWSGQKVSVLDTDHIWGHGMHYQWVWRSFMRGHNVLFMDPWDPLPGWHNPPVNVPNLHAYVLGRKAMKLSAELAAKMDMSTMKPDSGITSTKFCLANPGQEYLLYVPKEKTELDLTGVKGRFRAEWTHPTEGFVMKDHDYEGGKKQLLWCPFYGDAIVHLKRID